MTAYVLWGMTLARQAGIDVKQDVARTRRELSRQGTGRRRNQLRRASLDAPRARCLSRDAEADVSDGCQSQFQAKAFNNLWTNRDKLNAYTRALLALAAHNFGYQRSRQRR